MIRHGIFTNDELERLEALWEEIKGINNMYYGCKPWKYSSVILSRQTIEEDGFQSFILIGGKGHGKSTYTIKSTAFYFMIYEDLSCSDAYIEALQRLAFTAEELLDTIEEYRDIVIWDDAGLHGSTYYWFVEGAQEYLIALNNWYDVVRTDVNIIFMSTPTKKKLPPVIRSDPEALLVRVRKHGWKTLRNGIRAKTSIAIGVRNLEPLYTDRTIREEVFRDHFTVWLPTPVYEYYDIIRKKYSEQARKTFRDVINKMKREKTIPLYKDY